MKKILILGGNDLEKLATHSCREKATKDTIHLTKDNMENVTITVFPKAEILVEIMERDMGIIIVNNNHEIKNSMREQYLLDNPDIDNILKFSETKIYDKPKSKYHK